MGYSITGFYKSKVFFVLFGPGDSGKSVINSMLDNILGRLSAALPVSLLLHSNYGNNDRNPGLNNLRGVRHVAVSEPHRNAKFDESLLKTIIGNGDAISPNIKFKSDEPFIPYAKLWMTTN
jgi:putative DNA primase/helicase